MPLATLIKQGLTPDAPTHQDGVLVKEGNLWVVLDPETNNELIKGMTEEFIQQEINAGRLQVAGGWHSVFPHPPEKPSS